MVPSVTGKKAAHSLPEAARRDPPLQRAKAKVVGSAGKNLMARDEDGSSNYPIVEVYNDGSKTLTSHMKVPPGYAVSGLWCCQESVWSETCRSGGTDMCTERVNELETSATLRQSMRVILYEESEIRLSVHS